MQTLQVFMLLAISAALAAPGFKNFGGGGGHGGGSGHGHGGGHSSASGQHHNQHVQIKGGIGDGYIYPAKGGHGKAHGSGGAAKTYKIIIQNAPSHGGGGATSFQSSPQHADHVKTFKIITQKSAPPIEAPAHHQPASVKTIKLIHVKSSGGGADCASPTHGWQ